MAATQPYALITGGTSGIGYELVKLFAQDNYNLIIVARGREALDKTAAEIRSAHAELDVITISKDLFEPEAAFELYEEISARGIQPAVLVNDAGQGVYGEFKDTEIQRELAIIQLNISSLVVLTKLCLKDMIATGAGKILNVSSVASKVPGPYQSVYHGTKAFVQSFTEAIRAEIKDKELPIVITALLPGATDTDFFKKADMLGSKVMEGKLDNPAKVAKDGYDALMSDDDKVISGFKNKVQVAMSNLMPESTVANNMLKQQEPRDN